ncbi:MAG TPA: DUF86 domain-containing protein [Thermoanaerobaculia bacterium]|jgi:uncharacterized protein with HEPN domain
MTFADYERDDKTRWAIEPQFITVGEALIMASKLDETLEQKLSTFRAVIDFRNVLVHAYGELLHDVVWTIITEDLTRLTTEVKALLATLPDPQTPA